MDRIEEMVDELHDEAANGRARMYEALGSGGTALLEPLADLLSAARDLCPKEAQAMADALCKL